MLQKFKARNATDGSGMPAGGKVEAIGLEIDWQDGPLKRIEKDGETWKGPVKKGDIDPNGAFVETVIAAARQRIQWYQEVSGGRFACIENAEAITWLDCALEALDKRTQRRTVAGVEGSHAMQPGHDGVRGVPISPPAAVPQAVDEAPCPY